MGDQPRDIRALVADLDGAPTLSASPLTSLHELVHAFNLKSKSEVAPCFTRLVKMALRGARFNKRRAARILGQPNSMAAHGNGDCKGKEKEGGNFKIRSRDGGCWRK